MGCCCSRDINPDTVWYRDFLKSLPNLLGKRVAITGTTTGTGYIAALTCAQLGAEVFLLNRASERVAEAEKRLREEFPSAIIHNIACDLMDFASVREAATNLLSMCNPGGLDVLCCNAGIMAFPDKQTGDGYDVQMQTNHLSHFLLVKRLMPALEEAAKLRGEARIVNHSSAARFGGPLEAKYFQQPVANLSAVEDKGKEENRSGDSGSACSNLGGDSIRACFERYHQTKLANIVFTYALADKLKSRANTNIKVLCCTPGIAATGLIDNLESSGTDLPTAVKCVAPCFMRMWLQSAEDGTMPLLTAIAGAEAQSGDLFTPSQGGIRAPTESYGPVKVSRRPMEPLEKNRPLEDKEAQQLLWKESEAAIDEEFTV